MEWNEPLYQEGAGENGRIGVLLIHGFSGSPRALHEWALTLTGAGYAVAVPLLSGHGSTLEAFEKAAWTHWTDDVERARNWLEERTDEVFIGGFSMGGTLALWLAQRHPETAGVITVNAAIRDPRALPIRLLNWIRFRRPVKGVSNDAKLPGVDEGAYERVPVRVALQYAKMLVEARRDLAKVSSPILIFSSVDDHVIPPANQQEIYDLVSSLDKALVKLEDSFHIATMDNDRTVIFAKTLEFIAAHAGRG